MISKNEYLKLCAEKPDLFGVLPDAILSAKRIEELRQIPRVAVGEIPVHGSLEPLLGSLSRQRPDAFVPTIAYTGTEYGSWGNLQTIWASVKKLVEKKLRIYCAEPVLLGAPRFWWALNGLYMRRLYELFGMFGTCYGCRLYAFALRIPLCRTIEAHMFMPAAQGPYEGCAMAESKMLIHYSGIFMAGFGIEVVYAHASTSDTAPPDSEKLSKQQKRETLSCVLAPHMHQSSQQSAGYSNRKTFFESYAVPAVARIISRKMASATVDYSREIDDIIIPIAKSKNKK